MSTPATLGRDVFVLVGTIECHVVTALGSNAMALPETLRALSPEQKLALVTELWNDLAASAPLTLPPNEMAEMQRRQYEMRENPSIAIDRDELWRRVNGE